MTHNEILDLFFSHRNEEKIHGHLLEDPDFVVPLERIKDFMVQLTQISLVEIFNYLDNHPFSQQVETSDITQCGALQACTDEMCEVLRQHRRDGLSAMDIGKAEVFAKYLRSHNKASWSRYGSEQVKAAQQLGLAFKNARRWYLSCYGYTYAYPFLNARQQQQFLCRALLRNTFYARILCAVRTEEVHLSQYMGGLSASTQGRRSSSVVKMLELALQEMEKEGMKWHDIYVPRYRAKTKELVDRVLEGTMRASDAYGVHDEFFEGAIPLYTVKAACGYFDSHEVPEQEGWIDVSPSGVKGDADEYFVVYAKGDSMLPVIKDGDLCLFKWYRGEALDEHIVLTQCRDYDDEYESSYTIKRFHVNAVAAGEPRTISLEPLNKEKYHSILLSEADGVDYRTIGVFVKTLRDLGEVE